MLFRSAKMNAPNAGRIADPYPPGSRVPPATAAVIAWNSCPVPRNVSAPVNCTTWITATSQAAKAVPMKRAILVRLTGAPTLRAALAVGADAAILLQGTVTVDGLATAKALAAELKQHDAPLVLFGVKSGDVDQQQVGPMVATLLGHPCASSVSGFTVDGDTVV